MAKIVRAPPEAQGTVAQGPVALMADTMRDALAALARDAALLDGADVVILGGAPLAGLAATLAADCPAPLARLIAEGSAA